MAPAFPQKTSPRKVFGHTTVVMTRKEEKEKTLKEKFGTNEEKKKSEVYEDFAELALEEKNGIYYS